MLNYFPIGKTNADVYIGTGAGTRIIQAIEDAESEIKIVSPFLSANLVDILKRKAERGIAVTLITNDMNSKGFYDITGHENIVRQVFRQVQTTITEAINKKEKRKIISLIWLLINIIAIVSPLVFLWNSSLKDYFPVSPLFLFAPIILSVALNIVFYMDTMHTTIYNYDYIPIINMIIFKNNYSNRKGNIHAKIYCIDNKIAYLGSLNYTHSGFEHHFESCVSITNPEAVKAISEIITKLSEDDDRNIYTISELRRHYFRGSERPY